MKIEKIKTKLIISLENSDKIKFIEILKNHKNQIKFFDFTDICLKILNDNNKEAKYFFTSILQYTNVNIDLLAKKFTYEKNHNFLFYLLEFLETKGSASQKAQLNAKNIILNWINQDFVIGIDRISIFFYKNYLKNIHSQAITHESISILKYCHEKDQTLKESFINKSKKNDIIFQINDKINNYANKIKIEENILNKNRKEKNKEIL